MIQTTTLPRSPDVRNQMTALYGGEPACSETLECRYWDEEILTWCATPCPPRAHGGNPVHSSLQPPVHSDGTLCTRACSHNMYMHPSLQAYVLSSLQPSAARLG